jgi:signal peptidase I
MWLRYWDELEVVLEELVPENIPAVPEENTTSGWKHIVLDVVETLLLAAVLFFVINSVSARVRVDGFSMRPTLEDGELVLVNKLAYWLGQPKHGDIVVFRYPVNPSEDLIKRVIGLPGDVVKIQDGKLYINGLAVSEPYIAAAPEYYGEWVVPQGQLFVLGDNRNDSLDSHEWGVLPQTNVIGRAILIYWPPPEWNSLAVKNVVYAAP